MKLLPGLVVEVKLELVVESADVVAGLDELVAVVVGGIANLGKHQHQEAGTVVVVVLV